MTVRIEDHAVSVELTGGTHVQALGRLHGETTRPGVVVLGGVSAGKHLLGDADRQGWWPGVADHDGALTPNRFALLGADFLGEEVSPFPTLADQARAIVALANAAGLDRFAVVGASYGGAIALELASAFPDRVTKLVLIAAAGRVHPMAQAWRSVQRGIVRAGVAAGDEARGVDLARRLAMTTYRTPEEFAERFRDPDPASREARGIGAWLAHHGETYAARTSAKRFLALSHSMDQVEIDFTCITAPAWLLGFDSDQLVPPCDVEWTASQLPGAALEFRPSLYGHDGFLKEVDAVNAFLARAFA
ncbi:alpha/beta fold hydrolase [Hyphobacterium marinum]|uniref:Alpha/beta fold hydrolase n=1 Tax=Hyphobacterium marinum TaxID=3116574 RepID=A0ABU7LW85_9PROT|nr:alpha/beta fold hydrolase [Hyphobacterium sp. Y6023]MEE2565779.1 alpha/beta fold hydrolase [Hyphobacterium sp. Y6023]